MIETCLLSLHDPMADVAVTVKVVVTDGVASGLAAIGLLSGVEGSQLYVNPGLPAVSILIEFPMQIEVSGVRTVSPILMIDTAILRVNGKQPDRGSVPTTV